MVKIYELIERLVGPHTRKLELFGREHNIRKGWLSILPSYPLTLRSFSQKNPNILHSAREPAFQYLSL